MGGLGTIAEPLVVVALLIGGTWINRDFNPRRSRRQPTDTRRLADEFFNRRVLESRDQVPSLLENDVEYRPISPSLLASEDPKWRTRSLRVWGMQRKVRTPNTRRFKDRLLSRLLEKLPFLVECWYWALIYWVYQLGRAATAVWIVEGTIHTARKHALQVIAAEKHLHIFWELPIQQFFMQNEFVMTWINRIYSFIHIPGSIAFLVWLFYYTTTRNRINERQKGKGIDEASILLVGPRLYESRRRTMAYCNLLAFIIFTVWPCMPPRLLSADTSQGETGKLARSYGFVDTVHGPGGEGSIWTDNRFTNKFAAMPSLHFGYSLLIGVTIATIPLNPPHRSNSHILPFFNNFHPKLAPKVKLPSWNRLGCVAVGTLYPSIILVAIFATANHFILDAVIGAMVVAVAFWGNDVMLNLLVIEDWFLWSLGIHKPEHYIPGFEEED